MCLDTGDFGLQGQERRDCTIASDLILCFFNIFSVSSLKFSSVGLCLSTLSSTNAVVLSPDF